MPLPDDRLRETVAELLKRPKHEKVRANIQDLLVNGLGAKSEDIIYEQQVWEVRGRMDSLLGRTVFEFKSDLRKELATAQTQLERYLTERERQTRQHYVGIAADGADFISYELQGGRLSELAKYKPTMDNPRGLLGWLGGAVTLDVQVDPTPDAIRDGLGRGSIAWFLARARLREFWSEVAGNPEVQLKRQLWADLLARVYGSPIDDSDLFLQHTYMTIIAKVMATRVLGLPLPEAADLLSGKPFHDAGIGGAVESDFFDWLLHAPASAAMIAQLASQVGRFRLEAVQHDVLKGLYESLIDPEQRHDLGEYYTPDWLADLVCERAIERPLEQRVLDPSCGSGAFLFQAVRRFLAAADAVGMSNKDALAQCCNAVLGIDVHPVAVLIARVTYLLALGAERLRDRSPLNIPVYLGDSLQWNVNPWFEDRDLQIPVPPDGTLLQFPASVIREAGRFDELIGEMQQYSQAGVGPEWVGNWLQQRGLDDGRNVAMVTATYENLKVLHETGRNHIWSYILRNLARPVWLSMPDQKMDVLVGNPPWLSYRFMSKDVQKRFKDQCEERGIWAGGKVATHQDLSAYFFVRATELYLKELTGTIAFVMPYAALNRLQFQGFRTGWYQARGKVGHDIRAIVRFTEAWAFDETVYPLFPVPSCVLFARRGDDSGPLPATITAYSGSLATRDAGRDAA